MARQRKDVGRGEERPDIGAVAEEPNPAGRLGGGEERGEVLTAIRGQAFADDP